MTITADPFSGPATTTDDPFGTPSGAGGGYPRVAELIGRLLILEPVKMEIKNGDYGPQERWEADTTVFDADGSANTYTRMFWSQKPIAEELRKAQKGGRPVLGVLTCVPAQDGKKKYSTSEELLADPMMKLWVEGGGHGRAPVGMAWVLKPASDAQKARAITWWNTERLVSPF